MVIILFFRNLNMTSFAFNLSTAHPSWLDWPFHSSSEGRVRIGNDGSIEKKATTSEWRLNSRRTLPKESPFQGQKGVDMYKKSKDCELYNLY